MNKHEYIVTYSIDGRINETWETAENPGAAFAACLKKYPKAKLIKAEVDGKFGFRMTYDPPPVQREPKIYHMGPRKPRRKDPEGMLPL